MKMFLSVLLLIALLFPASVFSGDDRVASVKALKGEASISRVGLSLPVVVGMPLFQADRVLTGKGSALSLILLDDTTVSLGPESELDLKEYVFDPQDSHFLVVLRMLKGTFIYLSGVMGKLAPESIRLETPDATIAVRGTRVLVKVTP